MDGGTSITMYDVVVIGLFAALIGRGIWLGFLKQVTGLLALYLGYIVAGQYHDKFFPFLRDISDNPEIVFLASYALMFIATYIVVMLLGRFLAYVVQVSIVGWFDRVLGAILGFAKALIIVVLMHMIVGTVLPPESKMLQTCQTCDTLNGAVEVTRKLIRSEDVRKALQQREPAISLEAVQRYLAPLSARVLDGSNGKLDEAEAEQEAESGKGGTALE